MITADSTIREYLEYWITPACTPGLSEISREREKGVFRNMIIPFIGDVPLSSFHLQTIHILEEEWQKKGKSEKTCNVALRFFRTAMRYAESQTLIRDSLESSFHIHPGEIVPIPIYTPEQIKGIFHALRVHPMRN